MNSKGCLADAHGESLQNAEMVSTEVLSLSPFGNHVAHAQESSTVFGGWSVKTLSEAEIANIVDRERWLVAKRLEEVLEMSKPECNCKPHNICGCECCDCECKSCLSPCVCKPDPRAEHDSVYSYYCSCPECLASLRDYIARLRVFHARLTGRIGPATGPLIELIKMRETG